VTTTTTKASLVLLLAFAGGCGAATPGAGATSDCRASCPKGSEWDGSACRYPQSSVVCPAGSRFQGRQCVPTERVADVRVQALIDGSTVGKNKKALLTKDFEAKQKELDEMQERLLEEKKVLESGKLGEAAKKHRREKYERELAELARAFEKFQADLRVKERALTSEILTHVQRAAERVALAQGFSVVYFEEDVLWTKPGSEQIAHSLRGIPRVDVTAAVLDEMNRAK
jgi:Skp family chaperone for outer membrane proteins